MQAMLRLTFGRFGEATNSEPFPTSTVWLDFRSAQALRVVSLKGFRLCLASERSAVLYRPVYQKPA